MDHDAVKQVLDTHIPAKQYSYLFAPVPALLFMLFIGIPMTDGFSVVPSGVDIGYLVFFGFVGVISGMQSKRQYNKKMAKLKEYTDSPEDFIQDLRQSVADQKAKSLPSSFAQGITLEEQLLIALDRDEKIQNKANAKEELLRRLKRMYFMSKYTTLFVIIGSLFLPALYLVIEWPVDITTDRYFLWFAGWAIIFLLGIGIPLLLVQRNGRKLLQLIDTNPQQARTLLLKKQQKFQKNRMIDKKIRKQNEIATVQLMELFDTVVRQDTIAEHPEDYQ